MGCVHTHRMMHGIEGWGSLSHVRSVMQKIEEDNWKVGKISRAISQTPAPRLKHDKIWHDGPQMFRRRVGWKGYDGANVPRWNLEDEPFVVWWVVQMEEDTNRLGVVENHMPH